MMNVGMSSRRRWRLTGQKVVLVGRDGTEARPYEDGIYEDGNLARTAVDSVIYWSRVETSSMALDWWQRHGGINQGTCLRSAACRWMAASCAARRTGLASTVLGGRAVDPVQAIGGGKMKYAGDIPGGCRHGDAAVDGGCGLGPGPVQNTPDEQVAGSATSPMAWAMLWLPGTDRTRRRAGQWQLRFRVQPVECG